MSKLSREEFLARRKSGIGGSDVAAVMGVSPWKTPYQLWLDKLSPVTEEPENDILHFGNVLEDIVAKEYARRNNVKVQRRNQMYRKQDAPELIVNIDRYVIGGKILECKTCSAYASSKFGVPGSSDIPDYYYLQCLHAQHVTGILECDLAALIGGNEYREFFVEYDKSLAGHVAAKCSEFWHKYVSTKIPPPATAQDNLAEYFIANGEKKLAPERIKNFINEYKNLKSQERELKDQMENVSAEIKLFTGEAEYLVDECGGILATWKKGKDRATVDWKALAAAHNITADEILEFTNYSTNRLLAVK